MRAPVSWLNVQSDLTERVGSRELRLCGEDLGLVGEGDAGECGPCTSISICPEEEGPMKQGGRH